MSGSTGRGLRVLRGLGAAAVAVFVAAFSHVAGGGGAPGAVGLVLAVAFAAVVCVSLAGKAFSTLRLAIGVGLSQIAFHLLFSVGTPLGGAASSTGMSGMAGTAPATGAITSGLAGSAGAAGTAGMAGMSHGSDVLALLLGGGVAQPAVAHAASGTAGASGTGVHAMGNLAGLNLAGLNLAGLNLADCGWMWVAHLVAAVVTVWAVRRGVSAVASVIQSARMLVLRLVRVIYVERPDVQVLHGGAVAARDPGHPPALDVVIGRLRHRGPPVLQFSFS